LESLRTGEARPLIADRRVRKYVAYCTARDALAACAKKYGTFTPAQYREAVYLLGIGRPTTRAALDREADRVLTRPKYARVRRSGPDAAEERYATRDGEKKRASAEREYVAEAFDELKAAAGKLAKAVLVKTAAAATGVMERIAAWVDPAPTVVRLDGRDGDTFLKAHTPTGYLVAHGKALLSGLLVRGNPHERAGVAENTFKRLRSHASLPRGAVLLVERPDALSVRQLRRLADVAKRDGASVVLAGAAANERDHGRARRDRDDVGRDRRD